MRRSSTLISAIALVCATAASAQPIKTPYGPAQLDIRASGERSIRVTLKPIAYKAEVPEHPAIAQRNDVPPAISLREIGAPVQQAVGSLRVEVRPAPLTVRVSDGAGRLVQEIVFEAEGGLAFKLDEHPVLGMGGGGPRPERGTPWRDQPVCRARIS